MPKRQLAAFSQVVLLNIFNCKVLPYTNWYIFVRLERCWCRRSSWMARRTYWTAWWNSYHAYYQKYWWVVLIFLLDLSVKTTLMIINCTKQMNNVNMQNDGRAVELEFLKVLASDNFDRNRLKIAISICSLQHWNRG